MIKSLSSMCANWLARNSGRADLNATVLRFGLELLFTSTVGVISMIVVSLVFGKPWAWLFFLAGFAPQRTTAGGFHARSHSSCITISTLIFSSALVMSYYLNWSAYLYLTISIISLALVLFLSPVEAANKKLKNSTAQRNRLLSILFSSLYAVLACILSVMDIVEAWITILYSGIAFASASLVIAKINLQKRRSPL